MTRDLLLAALVGAVAGVSTNVLLSIIRRAVNNWRLDRIRGCRICRGLRVLPQRIDVDLGGQSAGMIEVDIPCPVCNPNGKFPARIQRTPAK